MFKFIKEHWGVNLKGEYAFFISEKNNVYASSKDVGSIDLQGLNINSIGFYMFEWKGNQVRPSIEGSQIIGPKATKNVIELNKGLFTLWMAGHDLEYEHEPSYVIIKHNNDFIGCGRAMGKKIINFVPKARRLVLE
ncbi:MAG: hypothetical protein ACE5FT_05980 [Candidatus Nanoarchaeia archaeon]